MSPEEAGPIGQLINEALDLAGDVATGAIDGVREALVNFDENTDASKVLLHEWIEKLKIAKAALESDGL